MGCGTSKIDSSDKCVDWSEKGNVGSLVMRSKDLHCLNFALVSFKMLETWNSTKESQGRARWWDNRRNVFNLTTGHGWEWGQSGYWFQLTSTCLDIIPGHLVNGATAALAAAPGEQLHVCWWLAKPAVPSDGGKPRSVFINKCGLCK